MLEPVGIKEMLSNRWRFLGIPIFGGWLPYIGFRSITFTKEELSEMFHYEVTQDGSYNPIVIEWCCRGLSFGKLKMKRA